MKQKRLTSFGYRLKYILASLLLAFSIVLEGAGGVLLLPAAAAPGDGRMLLFWPGGSIPSGWTCISCTAGDPFYQVFPRGNTTYGTSGGTATHNHTTTNSIAATAATASSISEPGAAINDNTHGHSLSVSMTAASNLPAYRQLQIIRADTTGEPTAIPNGAIGLFDSGSLPAGFTTYSAQNGWYVRGENGAGTTGGNNTHTHPLSITIGAATGGTHGIRNGSQVPSAAAGHTHTASGSSSSVNNEPPYVEVVFGQASSDTAPPNGLLAMWDNDAPINWTLQSGVSGSFNQRFLKGASSFGATGGSSNHTHVNTQVTTSGPSAVTNSRSGTSTASDSHTHIVTLANYSSESQLPPYRDVIIAKRVPQPTLEQSGYRFYQNSDGTSVSNPLAGSNTPASSPRQGKLFRLRMLVHVSDADLGAGNKVFKLQFAPRVGTCDVGFSGETYVDISTSGGDIRFADNTSPVDGAALATSGDDPIHSGHTVVEQTYEENNNFTNSNPIVAGQDGLWDFALQDVSAPANTSYCFRVVESIGTLLDSYSTVPEIITDDGNGHMLLLWDGASVPSGWSCVSCASGDDFYQRFVRGADTYGATGGTATHTHTAGSTTVTDAIGTGIEVQPGSGIASGGHSHSASVSMLSASNLPAYRQLKIIRADVSGVPSTIPAGAIAFFDSAVPAGWTRYSAQDNAFVRGENSITTGGSNTHTHTISGSLSTSSGQSGARTNGGTGPSASDGHTHTVSAPSTSGSNVPPYIQAILGKINADSSVPQNIITMWDNPEPVSWTDVSTSGQPFNNRFVLPAASYGTTGGSDSHSHTDSAVASSGPSATGTHRTGSGNADGSHTHTVTLASISTQSQLPPYIDVIFAKMGNLNTAPDMPANVEQRRTSDNSLISAGAFTNSGQVTFVAEASDTDNPDSLQLCVEVQETGISFSNSATDCGSSVAFNGTAVDVSVTISGLDDGASYHWQAQIKDSGGAVSAWISFGANAETSADFIIDSAGPTGTVYDGTVVGMDVDYNDGSLDTLHANWDINDSGSGLSGFEYAVGSFSGADDVLAWTNAFLTTSASISSLTLETSQAYYIAIRATDNAGNQVLLVSDGQLVAPMLSFSTTTDSVQFDGLNPSNNYEDSEDTIIATTTNARNGYMVRAYVTGLLQSTAGDTIGMFSGGTYAEPDAWLPSDLGFGYTSSDPLVQGVNKFQAGTCAGGGSGPCFAPFAIGPPGEIVADNQEITSGSLIDDESFTITHRVRTLENQNPGRYQTVVVFNATAVY